MITILGENIDLIRPRKIQQCRKDNNAWKSCQKGITKTRKIGIAEFFRFCLSYDYTEVERKKVPGDR